ncbi:LOW QUALITY PROTEIN: ATP-binding cassette sub-family A member 13 [Drosophila tropicalis]|uniref:LOW QUALITY PROTEIN: ATP-binding cassette sub-family A member 13 n=1 Tax=Drosophila tropicalis TaxID=46794 RepID=UPI0035ABB90D
MNMHFNRHEIGVLLRKDLLVRWRQKGLTLTLLLWPVIIFMLLYIIRLKYGSQVIEECQYPTRLLPTKNQVVPSAFSYICSIENKCLKTEPYEEYSKWKEAPLHAVIDVVNAFVTDERLHNAVVELADKANFVSAITTLITSDRLDIIRTNISAIISLVPEIERMVDYNFDIKHLFSNRETFVKFGKLLCGHPFPSTESIPLVNDILDSEDFSATNDKELEAMPSGRPRRSLNQTSDWRPSKYCKRLYLDVTSTNQGKLTWNTVKPIIQGRILYTPSNADTESIIKFANATFEEVNKLKQLATAAATILTKLHTNATFQEAFDNLLKLARSPLVKGLVGDDFDIGEIERVFAYIRTNQLIYDILTTISNLLECVSADRFEAVSSVEQLQRRAYELNQNRLFLAAINFEQTEGKKLSYKMHMDTDNTQPTFENRNRFWFPGPADSMLVDLKYHRGFVQIKQIIDLGIIKYKREQLGPIKEDNELELNSTAGKSAISPFTIHRVDDDDLDFDDDWSVESSGDSKTVTEGTAIETTETPQTTITTLEANEDESIVSTMNPEMLLLNENVPERSERVKRQGLLDLLSSFGGGGGAKKITYDVDDMQFYTKQFPYPTFVNDVFKRGLYLSQAVQVAYCLGLVVAVAICVRERIWMRESRNSMLLRSMGLQVHSELMAWILISFLELCCIFILTSLVLYSGGILAFTNWFFMMFYCLCFGLCLISFCYMCSNFFTSANIGAVATSLLFFITLCPFIIVLMFDAKLNFFERFLVDLSFTTAFAKGWSELMRYELQQEGLGLSQLMQLGPRNSDCAMALLMFALDLVIYAAIGYAYQRYKKTNYSFVRVKRAQLDPKLGASLANATKTYGQNCALSNLTLDFARNQVSCLLGRNGAGKSTLIKLLTGQISQTSGQVLLAGEDNVGVCWQDNILIPNLNAREHLEMYAQVKLTPGHSGESVDKEVRTTLKSLNFGQHESYPSWQLSGGYKRRLCVAIAFIASPNLVILDEPCNGVDAKARKDIWQLIEQLRQGRAVIFATHFLDEAKYLSDSLVIMRNGRIIAQHSRDSLQNLCTSYFSLSMHCSDALSAAAIVQKAQQLLMQCQIMPTAEETHNLIISASYAQNLTPGAVEFLEHLQAQEADGSISDLQLTSSSSLEEEFEQLNRNETDYRRQPTAAMGSIVAGPDDVSDEPPKASRQLRLLLGKRLRHFARNYRLLLYVLLLPAIFELCAMWFVSYRLEDDFDTILPFSRSLYAQSSQLLSHEDLGKYTNKLYQRLHDECTSSEGPGFQCQEFNSSKEAFHWVLTSLDEYRERRYGGYGLNGSGATVWYNNKGYHSMMAWLNDLNVQILRTSLNDSAYDLVAKNEPWKLGFAELSTSSILRQAGDSCMVFILLIAFGLVVAASSVYLVNERINGEKLQQRLCNVSAITYWLMAFIWDYLIMVLTLLICLAVVFIFNMPVFVDRQQLAGIIGLSLMFSFACVPLVHVAEKLFSDSSIAIVSIFCANIIIPLVTMGIILILGVVGDGPSWDSWRYGLNNAFLIFPQHALGDGLLEICKNYMVALVFKRYDIDSYKHPLASDLLQRHFTALVLVGIGALILNVLIECHLLRRLWKRVELLLDWQYRRELEKLGQLKLVNIQTIFKTCLGAGESLRVENLWLAYSRGRYAVRQVHFGVQPGECFGLLGKNGAGKSTIFKLLTGQLEPNVGHIHFEQPGLSYCPQSNPLDPLLTVSECILFYGQLRGIKHLDQFVERILNTYELRSYSDVQVRNLSGGNRRKLTVAITCCGYTPNVLMDEPTSDMDPVTREFVYTTIQQLLNSRRAVILTSHSVSEIEHLCQRVAVLKGGQIVASNSPAKLKAQYGGYYSVSCFCAPAQQAALAKMLPQQLPGACELQHYAHSLRFLVKVGSATDEDSATTSLPKLSELFAAMRHMTVGLELPARLAISRCRFETVFERILDSSSSYEPKKTTTLTNGHGMAKFDKKLEETPDLPSKSAAVSGTLATGYFHNNYEETAT